MYFDRLLWAFTRGVRTRVVLSVALAVVAFIAGFLRFVLLGVFLASVAEGATLEQVGPLVVGIIAVIAVHALLRYVREMLGYQAGGSILLALRHQLFAKLLELGVSHVGRSRAGGMTVTVVETVEQLQTFFGLYMPQLFVTALTPILVLVAFAPFDLPTALVLCFAAIATLVVPAVLDRWHADHSIRRHELYTAFASEFVDAVQGLATLKAFGRSGERREALRRRADDVFRSTMGVVVSNSAGRALTVLGLSLGSAIALGWSATRAEDGNVPLVLTVVLLVLGAEVFRPIRDLSALGHQGLIGLASARTVRRMLEERSAVVDGPAPRAPNSEPSIVFDHVTFVYPGRSVPSLRDFSFTVRAGECVGVVGRSGAGKSTLVGLLERFHDPQEGRILIGGEDIRDLSLDALRRGIALVSQDPYFFHGTIHENIAMDLDATEADVRRAARAAHADEFIASLPSGYATMIGERGVRLSGGERQRLAIARALLRNASILVLDEATSHVDAESEHLIQSALTSLIAGRTTLILAHRLSSIARTDRIMTLEQGRLVESGTHEELLRRGGAYAELMAAQAFDAEDADDVSFSETASDSLPLLGEAPGARAPSDDLVRAKRIGWGETFRRLMQVVEPLRGELVATFVLGVLPVLALLGLSVTGALIVESLYHGTDFGGALAALVLLAPLAASLNWLDQTVQHHFAFRLLARMRADVFGKLERLAPAFLVGRRTGDLMSLVTHDIEVIEFFFAHTLGPAFVAALVPTGVLLVLGLHHAALAFALLPFLAAAAMSPLVGRHRIEAFGARAREWLGALNAHVMETLQGLREVTAYGFGPSRTARLDQLGEGYRPVRLAINHELVLQGVALDTVTVVGGVIVAVVGALLASQSALDPARLPLLTVLALNAFAPVSTLAQTARQLGDVIGAARRISALNDEPVPIRDGPGVRLAGNAPVAVTFLDVSFTYPEAAAAGLTGVTFEVAAGSTTALVGPSGAGKTTLAHLLMRFWDPTSGSVRVGGRDVREFTLDQLRAQVALVAQDTYLFNGSVRDNLLLARPEAGGAALKAAVERAGLAEVVESLPDGLDTTVGERGTMLSGGERQRIAIARAFLKDAPILVLDEATSHLDAYNESLVRRALDELRSDRTTLVIAHRLATVREADHIVVLDEGTVVEHGTHRALLSRGGLYARLIAVQVAAGRVARAAD